MTRTAPVKASQKWYRPLEVPTRYPLELAWENDCYHVCLWFADGEAKCTIALIYPDKDGGFVVRFVGDRPLQEPVNWEHFRELLIQGIAMLRQNKEVRAEASTTCIISAALALTDTGTEDFKRTFPAGMPPGWRVVEAIRRVLLGPESVVKEPAAPVGGAGPVC